jgi:hypothetical protein
MNVDIGTETAQFLAGNVCFEFSVLCLCCADHPSLNFSYEINYRRSLKGALELITVKSSFLTQSLTCIGEGALSERIQVMIFVFYNFVLLLGPAVRVWRAPGREDFWEKGRQSRPWIQLFTQLVFFLNTFYVSFPFTSHDE